MCFIIYFRNNPLQNSWKWFIYSRTQNVNRPTPDDSNPPKKRHKLNSMQKHQYPVIPPSADDELSNETNLRLLKEEWDRQKDPSKVKTLFIRTHAIRRAEIVNEESNATVNSILQEFKMLKKSSYVSI